MGAADVVPGVSGGTIAFISGIYQRFINALRSLTPAFALSLLRANPAQARRDLLAIHWHTLIPLGAGIALAMLTMSKLIIAQMENTPGHTYAFFFGLILASAWMPFANMRGFSPRHAAAILLAALAAYAFVGLRAGPIDLALAHADPDAHTLIYPSAIRSESDAQAIESALARASASSLFAPPSAVAVFDPYSHLHGRTDIAGLPLTRLASRSEAANWIAHARPLIVLEEQRAPLPFIFLCAALAISAMILPGISGSFLLLFLGQYHAVFSTIHLCLGHLAHALGRAPDPLAALTAHPWHSDFLFLGVFALGLLLGLATFSRVVAWLFTHAHDLTMAALTGLMLGALRQPAQVVLDSAANAPHASSYWTGVAAIALLGAALVLTLHFADLYLRSRRAPSIHA